MKSAFVMAAASAVKLSEPTVPKVYTPFEYYPDQLGWASHFTEDYDHYHSYDREAEIPEHFESLNDSDRFTRSMISQFAMEERNEDGSPSGRFYLNKDLARKASIEVLKTHKGLRGADLDNWMLANFEDTWSYYDTARDGKIEADRMCTFMRYLTHDANLNIQ